MEPQQPVRENRKPLGLALRPWQQPWQVCFVPCWQHWTMKPFRHRPPFQHIFLLRPYESLDVSKSHWIYTDWSFMGIVIRLLDSHEAAPLHEQVMREGAMIYFAGRTELPRPDMANGLWPLTCVTFVRQVLGLPFRFGVWTPVQLWHELIARGGKIVVAPRG